MSLSEATLKKLSKDEVTKLLLDYQNKFGTTLARMNTDHRSVRLKTRSFRPEEKLH